MDAAALLALSLAALLAARPAGVVTWHERAAPQAPAAPAARRSQPPATAAARPPQPRSDPWLGDDKLRHLTMSFAATSFAFAATRSLGAGEGAPVAAATAALAAGIGKELDDARHGRFFSLRDLAWDVAGVIAGYAVAKRGR
jgi:uncharacterized protein YfiM (DUF2279 family)